MKANTKGRYLLCATVSVLVASTDKLCGLSTVFYAEEFVGGAQVLLHGELGQENTPRYLSVT